LAALKPAFLNDFKIYEYLFTPDMVIPIRTKFELPPFSQVQFADNVRHLLHRDSNERPRAGDICGLFLFYCQVIKSPIAADIFTLYCPPFSEWRSIVSTYQGRRERLYALINLYAKSEGKIVSAALQTRLINHNAQLRYEAGMHKADEHFCFEDCLVEVCLEQGNTKIALEICRTAIENDAQNFWCWHKLCCVYLRLDDIDGAIEFCHEVLADDLHNPAPSLALANLYAAKLDFANAVRSLDSFAAACNQLLYSKDANVLFKQELKLDLFKTQERYRINNPTF
jgi:hypothetical protein